MLVCSIARPRGTVSANGRSDSSEHPCGRNSQSRGLFDPVEIRGNAGIILDTMWVVPGILPGGGYPDLLPVRGFRAARITVPGRAAIAPTLNGRPAECVCRTAGDGYGGGFQLLGGWALALFPSPAVNLVLVIHIGFLLCQFHVAGLHGLIEVQQEDVAVRVHFCAVDVHFGSFVAVD